ncbi:hypothetical protein GN303_01645 [Commensalibacter melissae]|nr:hypothetical protein [Commensalibacter melissae]QGT68046.1 hypothetical protein GN303_01645 [Commensalibacter melissae]
MNISLENKDSLSRKNKGLLALVVFLGILIIMATTILVFAIISRITHKKNDSVMIYENSLKITRPISILQEPKGTRIEKVTRQSDRMVLITLRGGGPDRLIFWDIDQQKKVAEVKIIDSGIDDK